MNEDYDETLSWVRSHIPLYNNQAQFYDWEVMTLIRVYRCDLSHLNAISELVKIEFKKFPTRKSFLDMYTAFVHRNVYTVASAVEEKCGNVHC